MATAPAVTMEESATKEQQAIPDLLADSTPPLDPEKEKELLSLLESGEFELALAILLSYKRLPSIRIGPEGLTLMNCACQRGRLDIVEILITHYPNDVKTLVNDTYSPLHVASKYGHMEIVKFLVESKLFDKATVNSPDNNSPLHLAAEAGHLNIVSYLTAQNICSVTSHNAIGDAPVHLASTNGHLPVIKYLISEAHSDPALQNPNTGQTLLHLAAEHGYVDIVVYLLDECQCDPSCRDKEGMSPLYLAAMNGKLDIVKYLINENGVNPMEVTTERSTRGAAPGRTPLHVACGYGHLDVVTYLVMEQHCDPVCKDEDGVVPLHIASLGGNLNIVKFLIEQYNCNPMCLNKDQQCPLHSAALNGHTEIVRFLTKEKQCNPMCRTKTGSTPLHLACQKGHMEVVKFLNEEMKCDPMCIQTDNNFQYLPLHYAACNGHTEIVRFLTKEKQCNPMCRTKTGCTPLHLACQEGHMEVVKFLTEEMKCDPMCIQTDNNFQYLPLHYAALNGHTEIVRFLTKEKQCNPMCRTKIGNTPLHLACQKGHMEVVKFLTEEMECDPMCLTENQWCPLHSAAFDGYTEIVRFLTKEKQCNPMCRTKTGHTPLHLACQEGHIEVVKFLTEKKQCDPMCRTKTGSTPLHLACEKGHMEVVKFLTEEMECDPMCLDENQWCPLHSAAFNGHTEIVRFLTKEKQCNPMCRTKTGSTPLHLACQKGHMEVVKFLNEEMKCDPMCIQTDNNFQYLPLHYAACNGHTEIVRFLTKEKQCNPMCRTKTGCTPLHLACQEGHMEVVKFLTEEMKCDPMCIQTDNNFQYLPLHYAALNGHTEIVRFLTKEKQCNPMCRTKIGNTPLHLACQKGHMEVVKFLTEEMECDPMCLTENQWCPLHSAAFDGYTEIVRFLTKEKQCNPMCRTKTGSTPLHLACQKGHMEVVKFLNEEMKCDPMCIQTDNNFQYLPLHYAACNGHTEIVRFLTKEKQCNPMCRTKTGCTPLHLACQEGHMEVVKFLTEEMKCDPMCIQTDNNFQYLPLHYAALNGHTEIVRFLTKEKQCNPMCRTKIGNTPLHLACQKGHMEVVKFLTEEMECDPMCLTENQWCPLHSAAFYGHTEIVRFLTKEKQCNPMCRTKTGSTPLHLACQKGHMEVVKFLTEEMECNPMCLDENLDPECIDDNASTPLSLAAANGCTQIVSFLIKEKHFNPMWRDRYGRVPLHLASDGGHLELVKYLIEDVRCDPMYVDDNKWCALHFAASDGHSGTEIAQFLVEKQCNLFCRTRNGLIPLHIASKYGHSRTVAFFLTVSPKSMFCRDNGNKTPLMYATSEATICEFMKKGGNPKEIQIPVASLSQKLGFLTPKYYSSLSGRAKVYITGNSLAGKSTLAKALTKEDQWMGSIRNIRGISPETAGIVPMPHVSKHFGSAILYDFAGHHEYSTSHAVVIKNATPSSHPVFILVVNMEDTLESIRKQVTYWKGLVCNACCCTPTLVVVGSHLDCLGAEEIKERRQFFSELIEDDFLQPLHFLGFVTLDCQKSESKGMTQLRQLLSESCTSARKQVTLNFLHSMLYAFLKMHFESSPPFQLSTLVQCLVDSEAPLPNTTQEVYNLCKVLSSAGYILLLKDEKSPECSWIVLNQEPLLHHIHGFHRNKKLKSSLKNTIGVVPSSVLQDYFQNDIDLNLIIKYLINMEFCQEIKDLEFLQAIGATPSSPPEPHYFFPDLIETKSPKNVWETDSRYTHYSGWCLSCCEPSFFTPRFLQVLLLRTASHFALLTSTPSTKTGKSALTLKHGYSIWKNGISWFNGKGTETVVEVIDQKTTVIALTRTQEECEVHHYQQLSKVIRTVLDIYREECPAVDAEEYIIHPNSIHCYPLPPTPTLEVVDIHQIADAVWNQDSFVIKSTLASQQSSEPASKSQEKLENVLCFELFSGLRRNLLEDLFAEDKQNISTSSDFLEEVAEDLCHKWELLAKALDTTPGLLWQLQNQQCAPTTKCKLILEEARRKFPEMQTYGGLREKLGKFSIFQGRNPLDYSSAYCRDLSSKHKETLKDDEKSNSDGEVQRSKETTDVLQDNIGLRPSKQPTLDRHAEAATSSQASSKSQLVLKENDLNYLLNLLKHVAHEWNRLGLKLGFLDDEIKNIQAMPLLIVKAPESYLQELLLQWLRRAPPDHPHPTVAAMVDALRKIGKESLANEFPQKIAQARAVKLVATNAVQISVVLHECGFQYSHWAGLAANLNTFIPKFANHIDVEGISNELLTDQLCLQKVIHQWLYSDTAASWETLANAVGNVEGYGDDTVRNILKEAGAD